MRGNRVKLFALVPLLIFGRDAIAQKVPSRAVEPDINFYLLLDDSPSMAIAATRDGIDRMVANTPTQAGGCAFACHESSASSEILGNSNRQDNYALARSLGVRLRIDDVRMAVQNLVPTVQTAEKDQGAAYRMAVYTFDSGFNTIALLTADLNAVRTYASEIDTEIVYRNNWLTETNFNDNEDTDYDTAMSRINAIMPNPGRGANAGGAPQEVLFIVTDGVEDERQCPAQNPINATSCRQQYLMNSNTDWCTTIKNRGIRIAVLYTEYLPLPSNPWYMSFIAAFQPKIGAQLQACASPGLYAEVKTGGDVSAALTALFRQSVATSAKTDPGQHA